VAVRSVLLEARGHVEIEFEGVIAEFGDDAFGLIGVRFGLGFIACVTVTVDPHLVSVLPADELVGWHLKHLARQVVQRDLDAGDRRDGDPLDRALARGLLDEELEEAIEVQGVFPHHEGRHPLDDLGDAGPPVGFSRPSDPGVGVQPDQGPGEVAVDHRGLDVGDLDVPAAAAFRRCTHRLRGELAHRVLGVRVPERRVILRHTRRSRSPFIKPLRCAESAIAANGGKGNEEGKENDARRWPGDACGGAIARPEGDPHMPANADVRGLHRRGSKSGEAVGFRNIVADDRRSRSARTRPSRAV
jgi:hypothetical protein